MGNITEKLLYLAETKELIKEAIIEKGVDMGEDVTFREYAEYINEIEGGGGATIPRPYSTYIAEAKEVYTGEYDNVIYAEGYGTDTGVTYHTVMFLLDNWTINAYDAATTGYTHRGFIMVQKEDNGAWVMTDYSNTSTDTHYAKNIKAASCYIEYNGLTLFPVGVPGYITVASVDKLPTNAIEGTIAIVEV